MNTDKFTYYDSVREFVNSLPLHDPDQHAIDWCGGETWESARHKALHGSIDDAARIEPLIERYLSLVDIPTIGRQRIMDVCGGCPMVPAYLSGEPEHFVNVRAIESATSPVRVFYDPTSSARVDSEPLLKRGAMIAAFVLALASVRPVELWIATSNQGRTTPCIKLGTSPFVGSEVAFAVGHVAFARRLTYGWSKHHCAWHGMWADWLRSTRPDESLREALEAAPEDIVLGPAFTDGRTLTDPEGWLRDTLRMST